MEKKLFFIFSFSFILFGAFSQTYYIRTDGIDSELRDGLSENTAWASLSYACSRTDDSGDTLLIGSGNFYETQTSFPHNNMVIQGVDTSSTHLYASINWQVSDTIRNELPTDYLIYLDRKNNFKLSNIHFSSADTSNMLNGAFFGFRSDYLDIHHVKIENFRWSGLQFFINNHCNIYNSYFRNCSQYKDVVWSGHIRTRYFNDSNIFNNVISSTWGFGYGYKASGHRNTKFYNNHIDIPGSFSIESAHENEFNFEIFDNTLTQTISVPKSGVQANPLNGGYDYSIWIHHNNLEHSYTIEGPRNHMIISYNYVDIKKPNGRFYTCFGGINPGPVYIHNNVVLGLDRSFVWKNNGNIDSIHVFNNTIFCDDVPTAGAVIDLASDNNGKSAQGWTFTNNVVVAPASKRRNIHWPNAYNAANLKIENNLFLNVDLVPEDFNNIIETMPDFKFDGEKPFPFYTPLCPSANIIDKGKDLGYPFSDLAPDLGAYEYDINQENRLPWDSQMHVLPAVIELEHYDLGGKNLAYFDDNIKTGDLSFRPNDDVDICSFPTASNNYAICDIKQGEWLEYSVEITPGLYDIEITRSGPTTNHEIFIFLDGDTLGAFQNLQSTNGNFVLQSLHDIIISQQFCGFLRIEFTGDVGFLDKIQFIQTNNIPVLDITLNNCPEVEILPQLGAQLGVDIFPNDAFDQSVIWTSSEPSILNVDNFGKVSTIANQGEAYIIVESVDGAFKDSCLIKISTDGQTNYDYKIHFIPGHIETEEYDLGGINVAYYDLVDVDRDCYNRIDEVDTQECQDTGGTCNTGWSFEGEWLEYTTSNTPGVYTFKSRMATNNNTGIITLSIDGNDLATVNTPATSQGWQDWQTASANNINIPGGEHVFRIYLNEGGLNLNWFEFEYEGPCECEINNSNCQRSNLPNENLNKWIGPINGSWKDSPCNWSKGCFPTMCDDVVVEGGRSIRIEENEIVKVFSISLEEGAELIVETGAQLEIK
jgi:hypothetical protein